MKKIACLLFVILLMVAHDATAQTRKIGHRSHSGSPATFALAMGEDHLGAYFPPEPNYFVAPFVEKIRKHYEAIATGSPAQPTTTPTEASGTTPADSTKVPTILPNPIKEPNRPTKDARKQPSPMASEVPSPDFLVQSQLRKASAASVAVTPPASSNGLWWWGLLAIPLAPGVFLASAIKGRKRSLA